MENTRNRAEAIQWLFQLGVQDVTKCCVDSRWLALVVKHITSKHVVSCTMILQGVLAWQVQYDDITKQLNDMAHAEGIEQTNIKYGENKVSYVVLFSALCSKCHVFKNM